MQLIVDGDSLFFDAYSVPEKVKTGFGRIQMVGQSVVPTEITPEILAKGLARVKRRIEDMRSKLFGAEMRIAVRGDGNFRYDIYPEYKSNRKNATTLLKDLAHETINLALDEGWVIPAHGMEADDLCNIWCNELGVGNYVLAHIDKDLNNIPGKHFNYRQFVMYDIDETTAMRNYYTQILVGDPTDSIPGARLIGPVKAAKRLILCKTEEDLQEGVVMGYLDAHPDDWYEKLTLNGSLIHLLRHPTDKFSCDDWSIVQALR